MPSKSEVKSLEKLFYQFQPALVAYANRVVYNEEDAREIVQDVFLGIWKNRDKLDLNEGLKAYLYRATRNRAINYLNRKKEETVELEAVSYGLSTGVESEERIYAEEMKAIIFDEVNQLPTRCKAIFLLSRQEGLSYKEIAEKLDVSTKTVENQIGIALKRLKERVYGSKKGKRSGTAMFQWSLVLFLLKNPDFFGGMMP